MKRVLLLLLAVASAAVVVLSLTGGIDLEGPARLLVVAGALIIVMASVDELRQAAPNRTSETPDAAPVAVEATVAAQEHSAAAEPSTAEAPMAAKVPAASKISESAKPEPALALAAAPTLSSPALSLSSPEAVIDLRDEPKTLVDELIADGQLSKSREPISDSEVPAIVMAAFAHQLSLQAA